MFTESQIAHLSALRFINNVDRSLKIISAIKLRYGEGNTLDGILLLLEIYFNGDRITEISFNLHNYSYDEIVEVARNVGNNDYIMQEVDTYLAGDVE